MNIIMPIITIVFCIVPAFSRMATIEPYLPADSVPRDTLLDDQMIQDQCSFKADAIPLKNALKLFAATNGLKLIADSIPDRKVSVAFENITFGGAMEKLLSGTDCSWYKADKTLHIMSFGYDHVNDSAMAPRHQAVAVTELDGARIFRIDYPRLKRTGQGSSTASISSAASGEAGSIALSTADEILFWQELEEQLRLLLSPTGKLVISKMAGIVHVTDTKEKLETIAAFIRSVVEVAIRQVEITARIYEVTLDNDHSLGIDWSMVNQSISRFSHQGSISGKIDVVRSSPDLKVATTGITLNLDGKLDLVIDALKEQGTVEAISQPRILTLNNQPALVKIGTDYPFFSANVTTNATTNQREVQEQVRVITVGVVLSVTPQISGDGWITLGIDPLISDLVSTAQSENGSTAPVIDVKQSSALVRIHDRTTIRISGLLQKKKHIIERKVPLLGDIPIIKYLFKWSYTKESQRELIIFITPRCI